MGDTLWEREKKKEEVCNGYTCLFLWELHWKKKQIAKNIFK